METKRIIIEDRNHIKDEELKEAASILRSGGLVAFPTETVYGLGGNALDEDAARKIYAAKGRPSDNPLIAHVSCVEEVAPLVKEIPEAGRKLMEAFWPGPLTMIFPKSEKVPYGQPAVWIPWQSVCRTTRWQTGSLPWPECPWPHPAPIHRDGQAPLQPTMYGRI